jgi:hypothetical protein
MKRGETWGAAARVLLSLVGAAALLIAIFVFATRANAGCFPSGPDALLAYNDPAVRACAYAQLMRENPNAYEDMRKAERLRWLQWRVFVAHDPTAAAEYSRALRER